MIGKFTLIIKGAKASISALEESELSERSQAVPLSLKKIEHIESFARLVFYLYYCLRCITVVVWQVV